MPEQAIPKPAGPHSLKARMLRLNRPWAMFRAVVLFTGLV